MVKIIIPNFVVWTRLCWVIGQWKCFFVYFDIQFGICPLSKWTVACNFVENVLLFHCFANKRHKWAKSPFEIELFAWLILKLTNKFIWFCFAFHFPFFYVVRIHLEWNVSREKNKIKILPWFSEWFTQFWSNSYHRFNQQHFNEMNARTYTWNNGISEENNNCVYRINGAISLHCWMMTHPHTQWWFRFWYYMAVSIPIRINIWIYKNNNVLLIIAS